MDADRQGSWQEVGQEDHFTGTDCQLDITQSHLRRKPQLRDCSDLTGP